MMKYSIRKFQSPQCIEFSQISSRPEKMDQLDGSQICFGWFPLHDNNKK